MTNIMKFSSIFFSLAFSFTLGATPNETKNSHNREVESEFIKVSATDRGVGFDNLFLSRDYLNLHDCLSQNIPDRSIDRKRALEIFSICEEIVDL